MHSIFKICISRNMKCDKTVGFLKYSHICFCWAFLEVVGGCAQRALMASGDSKIAGTGLWVAK